MRGWVGTTFAGALLVCTVLATPALAATEKAKAAEKKADLVIGSVEFLPRSPADNMFIVVDENGKGQFAARVKVENKGKGAADDTITKLTLVNTGNGKNVKLLGAPTDPLDKGESDLDTTEFDEVIPLGLYKLEACADAQTDAKESNEKNNCKSSKQIAVIPERYLGVEFKGTLVCTNGCQSPPLTHKTDASGINYIFDHAQPVDNSRLLLFHYLALGTLNGEVSGNLFGGGEPCPAAGSGSVTHQPWDPGDASLLTLSTLKTYTVRVETSDHFAGSTCIGPTTWNYFPHLIATDARAGHRLRPGTKEIAGEYHEEPSPNSEADFTWRFLADVK